MADLKKEFDGLYNQVRASLPSINSSSSDDDDDDLEIVFSGIDHSKPFEWAGGDEFVAEGEADVGDFEGTSSEWPRGGNAESAKEENDQRDGATDRSDNLRNSNSEMKDLSARTQEDSVVSISNSATKASIADEQTLNYEEQITRVTERMLRLGVNTADLLERSMLCRGVFRSSSVLVFS